MANRPPSEGQGPISGSGKYGPPRDGPRMQLPVEMGFNPREVEQMRDLVRQTLNEFQASVKGLTDAVVTSSDKISEAHKTTEEVIKKSVALDTMPGAAQGVPGFLGGLKEGLTVGGMNYGLMGYAYQYPGVAVGVQGARAFAQDFPRALKQRKGLQEAQQLAQTAPDTPISHVAGAAEWAARNGIGAGETVGTLEEAGTLGTGLTSTAGMMAGSIGAGVLAGGYAGYQIAQNLGELSTRYGALSGETGLTGTGGAFGYEARARMLALSPWISGEQGRAIVESTLRSGYNGREADTVMDYLAQNVRNGMTDINASLELYRAGTIQAGASSTELTTQLNTLQETAKNSAAGVGQLQEAFSQNLQGLSSAGLTGPGTASTAAFFAQQGALSGLGPGYENAGTPDFSNMLMKYNLARSYGVPIYQLPGAMNANPQGVPGQVNAAQVMMIQRLLPNISNMSVDEIVNSPQMMFAAQMMQGWGVITDPAILSNPYRLATTMKELLPGGKLTPQHTAEAMWKQYGVRDVNTAGTTLSGNTFAPSARLDSYFTSHGLGSEGVLGKYSDPLDIGQMAVFKDPQEEETIRLRRAYAMNLNRTGRSDPFVEQLIRSDTSENYLIRGHGDDSRYMTMAQYLAAHPGANLQQIARQRLLEVSEPAIDRHGSVTDVASYLNDTLKNQKQGMYTPAEYRRRFRGLSQTTIGDAIGLDPGTIGAPSADAAAQRVTIDLTPQAQTWLRPIYESNYRGQRPPTGVHDTTGSRI